jgi:hypothetical protein
MERASIDEVMKLVNTQLLMPLPGSKRPVSDAVVEDEMALFRQAAATPTPGR